MYEWDENKRQKNIEKHKIDFIDVKEMWDYPVCEFFSLQTNHNEERFLAIGRIKEAYITVVYTWRGGKKRLISARKARKHEKEYYDNGTW